MNRGPEEVLDGTTLSVYGLAVDGAWTLLGVRDVPGFIDNGFASAEVDFLVSIDMVERGLRLVAGE